MEMGTGGLRLEESGGIEYWERHLESGGISGGKKLKRTYKDELK